MEKNKIVLKLSGSALKDSDDIFSVEKINSICRQIKALINKYKVCVVVGGGNIWRGRMTNEKIISEEKAHYMGMVATIINSTAINECLRSMKVKTNILSALPVPSFIKTYSPSIGRNSFKKNDVLVLSGGTGKPFFSTDTGAAKDAKELGAKIILMGKDGVDGVYSDDPKTNANAERFETLTFSEAIKKKLQVMDLSALQICKKNNINIIVFNIERESAIINALNNSIPITIISNNK